MAKKYGRYDISSVDVEDFKNVGRQNKDIFYFLT